MSPCTSTENVTKVTNIYKESIIFQVQLLARAHSPQGNCSSGGDMHGVPSPHDWPLDRAPRAAHLPAPHDHARLLVAPLAHQGCLHSGPGGIGPS